MKQEPTTGRRIVSKGEYTKAQGKRIGLAADAVCLFIVAYLCFTKAPLLFYTLGAATVKSPAGAWLPLLIPVGGVVIFLIGRAASVRLREAVTLDAGVLLTRANAADLPANDSLVRASQEPAQSQEGVLLRAAAGERQAEQEGQLLRASVGGQE